MHRLSTAAVLLTCCLALDACAGSNPGPAPVTSTGPSSPASSPASTTAGSKLYAIHDPGRITGSYGRSHCTAAFQGQLPDRLCTPGSIDPAVTQANIHHTICKKSYIGKVRPPKEQADNFKYRVAYPAYGVPSTAKSELDYLVPLELGGSNDAKNLWPEVGPVPNTKDGVESGIHAAVCSGKVKLRAAQLAITRDWTTAEGVLGFTPEG